MADLVPGDCRHDVDGLAQLTRSSAIVAAIVAGLLLAGCGGETDRPKSAAPAQRIVALAPHLTELVYTAGAGEQLVGAVEYSDFPAEALSLPRVGDAFRLDYETISGLEPDLLLAWTSGTPADVQDRLQELGFRVVALDASGLDDIGVALNRIGALAGTTDIAAAAAARYSQRLAELRARYRDVRRLEVFYQISGQPLFTISGRHVISEAIETCGGRNVFADVGGLSPAISLEAVLVAEPDVIVTGDDALNSGARDELVAQWAEWNSVPAVRNGHLYVVMPT